MSKKKKILDNLNDFRALFYRISMNWYYFVLSIIFCLIVAFTYTRYSTELFSSSIKIQIDKNNSTIDDIIALPPQQIEYFGTAYIDGATGNVNYISSDTKL